MPRNITNIGTAIQERKRPLANTQKPMPAAEYVRMSDEAQQYSIDNQKAAIQEYANSHGFVVVKTYADPGKSGVVARHRKGLRELVTDVMSGNANYRAVLVYDVSRWGRYPNNDEAAYYEFICASSGIPLHYCAEPFANDGTAMSSLLKALKRSMAAEFSRELGEKVFRGKSRLVQLGYWVGGNAGYGFRRLMVAANGKPKQVMKPGEQKSFTTDRVQLVRGPRREQEAVRTIFRMAGAGSGPTAIARDMNRKRIWHNGRPWNHMGVQNILENPKYMGCNVWNRKSQRLHSNVIRVNPEFWIKKASAFPPIVDEATFTRAHNGLLGQKRWSDDQILKRLTRLLKTKGRVSETLIRKARGMPCTTTIHHRFGTYLQLYDKIGYAPDAHTIFVSEQGRRSTRLRESIIRELITLFPERVTLTRRTARTRALLLIDKKFIVSILFCGLQRRKHLAPWWECDPFPVERNYVTLACRLNTGHDGVLDYYVFSDMNRWKSHRLRMNDPILRSIPRLNSLSEFYTTVNRIWTERSLRAS
ncbi:MAG: recombinase family protein [Terracidiphilus sp.]